MTRLTIDPERRRALIRCFTTLATGVALSLAGCVSERPYPNSEDNNRSLIEPAPQQESSVVITGSEDSEGSAPPKEERASKEEIAALRSDAAASQGQYHGARSRGLVSVRTKAEVQNEIDVNRSRTTELEAARKKLFEDERYAAFPNRPSPPDPDLVAPIDRQLGALREQRMILDAELEALAASQRADASAVTEENGRPYPVRESVRTRAEVQNELDSNGSQIAELEAARKKLFEDERYAVYPSRPGMPDPDIVAALDKRIGDLKARKAKLIDELAALEAR